MVLPSVSPRKTRPTELLGFLFTTTGTATLLLRPGAPFILTSLGVVTLSFAVMAALLYLLIAQRRQLRLVFALCDVLAMILLAVAFSYASTWILGSYVLAQQNLISSSINPLSALFQMP